MSNIGTKFILANKFTFDPNNNSLVELDNESTVFRLGSNESRVLLLLAENANSVVTRNELHDFVWREQGFEVDDSSLTQAISTLRKVLNDSTKSPKFVKTAPKRGYQLICSVERTTPILSGDETAEVVSFHNESYESEPQNALSNELTSQLNFEQDAQAILSESHPTQENSETGNNQSHKLLVVIALLLSISLPIFAYLFSHSTEPQFRTIATFGNVAVKTPISHPQLQNWLPAIEQCITRYNEVHPDNLAPVEVIATGGQNHQLVLNYIHRIEHSDENVTLRLFAEQNDFIHICQ
ncbi:transcriptional activator ToxR [Vibrio ponticus]|nr:transcriptional activator ToxR [Vibrio ponticus]